MGRWRGLVVLLVALAVVAAGPVVAIASPAPAATPLRCGSVVTQSTTLAADLHCRRGEPFALRIEGAGVTLDLAGHVIRGDGRRLSDGIVVEGTGHTVRNGQVGWFDDGISVAPGATVTTSSLEIRGNRVGLQHRGAGLTVLGPRRIVANGTGLRSNPGSVIDLVEGVYFKHNGTAAVVEGGRLAAVRGVLIAFNGHGLLTTGADIGEISGLSVHHNASSFTVDGGGHGMRVVDSSFAFNGGDGIVLRGTTSPAGHGAEIVNSRFWQHGFGILVEGNAGGGARFHGNRVGDNDAAGIVVVYSARPTDGAGNPLPGPDIRGNVVNANGHDGTRSVTVGATTVTPNDGIFVHGPAGHGTVLAGNRVADNLDLGIEAVHAVDGGGNTARNNGNPAQCSGVACGPT